MFGWMRRGTILGLARGAAAWCAPAWTQSFPAKPVRIVVAYPPGGATDIVARSLIPGAQELLERLVKASGVTLN
jgi:tripartite-type tricarboxylate transporter receptor subunit TctC